MARWLVLMMVPLCFAGCATIDPIDLEDTDRVGVAVDVGNELVYHYRGGTVFANREETLDANLDRNARLAERISELARHNVEVIDPLVMPASNEAAIQKAAQLGYSHLILLSDGGFCLDVECWDIVAGSGFYGDAPTGMNFGSIIDYRIVDTETGEVSYSRNLMVEFYVGKFDVDPAPYAGQPVSNAIYCLDARNIEVAAWEMNRVSPLFDVAPQKALGSSRTGSVYEELCSFRQARILAGEPDSVDDGSGIPEYVWEAAFEHRCGGLRLLEYPDADATYYSAICRARPRVVACAEQVCRVVAPDSSGLPQGLDLKAGNGASDE